MHKYWILIVIACSGSLCASSQTRIQAKVYETFWQPLFRGEQLSYCDEKKLHCGRAIARQYCGQLGYAGVDQFEQAANLGLTSFISGRNRCQGWQCDGFAWIKCYGYRRYQHRPLSDYRQKLFALPYWRKFPLAWCGLHQQDCGKKVAYRFCRWQGYARVKSFSNARSVVASKSIANNALCIQEDCKGFDYIICAR